ncbi:MAG: hypothetical protein Q7T55_16615 [Solirubrobacteraceae bacterium]|nr:hypothetical protein [Solirubrobacteraceae bacterium]
MAGDVPVRRPKRRAAWIAGVLLLVVAVGGAALLLSRDDDGLGAVRDLPSVESAIDSERGRGLEVVLTRGASARDVEAVLRAFPRTESGVTRTGSIQLAKATLQVDGAAQRAFDVAPALVTAASLATAGRTITIPSGRSARSISAEVRDRADAVPLARSLVEELAPDGIWPGGIDGVFIEIPGGDRESLPVTLGVPGSKLVTTRGVLAVAADAADQSPVVSANSRRIELRLLARDIAAAGETWRSAASSLGRDAKDVELYVDVMQQELPLGAVGGDPDDDLKRRPVLFGTASDDPAAALALLEKLAGTGDLPGVATDRSYAQVTVDGASDARKAVALSERATIERVKLTWTAEPSGTDIADYPTTISDRPAVVGAMLDGVADASARFGIAWDRRRGDGRMTVLLRRERSTGPDRLALDRDVRALMTRVRGIAWPGSAKVRIPVGRGTCTGSRARSTVVITSTNRGNATAADEGSACTEEGAVAAAERNWDATRPR